MSTFATLLRRADTLRRHEDDPSRAALGRGYRAGLTLTMRDPD